MGGCKGNKYERDIRLLEGDLKDNPDNTRSQFYLANSYYDIGSYDIALKWYKSRIALGGWQEEVWYSQYRVGLCSLKLGRVEVFVHDMLMCYELFPDRLENIHELIYHFRCQGKYKVAYGFYKMIEETLNSKTYDINHLFFHNSAYDYKLYYEYIIIAYYNGITNVDKEYEQIKQSNIPAHLMEDVNTNLTFYQSEPQSCA